MPGPARILVRCTPRADRERIDPGTAGEFGVRVTAPAEDGKANAAVCRVLAKALGVPKSAVTVVRGHTARHKQLEVRGIGQQEAEDILARCADGGVERR